MILKRELGMPVITAIVIGNVIGSGIFFTPGELARVAGHVVFRHELAPRALLRQQNHVRHDAPAQPEPEPVTTAGS